MGKRQSYGRISRTEKRERQNRSQEKQEERQQRQRQRRERKNQPGRERRSGLPCEAGSAAYGHRSAGPQRCEQRPPGPRLVGRVAGHHHEASPAGCVAAICVPFTDSSRAMTRALYLIIVIRQGLDLSPNRVYTAFIV